MTTHAYKFFKPKKHHFSMRFYFFLGIPVFHFRKSSSKTRSKTKKIFHHKYINVFKTVLCFHSSSHVIMRHSILFSIIIKGYNPNYVPFVLFFRKSPQIIVFYELTTITYRYNVIQIVYITFVVT